MTFVLLYYAFQQLIWNSLKNCDLYSFTLLVTKQVKVILNACVFLLTDKIREDMCGFEEITREPDPIEVRPYGPTYVNLTMPPPPEDKTGEKQLIAGGTF